MSLPVILVIPAYKPSEYIMEMAAALSCAFEKIIVIDDGSGEMFKQTFEGLKENGTEVLVHHYNCGKGFALKAGFQYIIENYPNHNVLTADADGQHRIDDILKIAKAVKNSDRALVLGCRDLKGAPWRNRLGNSCAKNILRFLTGHSVMDTQTGLRAIPACMLPELVCYPEMGYDFEMHMLMSAVMQQYKIIEIGIATVYSPGQISHFSPVFDSLKIVSCAIREYFRNKFCR